MINVIDHWKGWRQRAEACSTSHEWVHSTLLGEWGTFVTAFKNKWYYLSEFLPMLDTWNFVNVFVFLEKVMLEHPVDEALPINTNTLWLHNLQSIHSTTITIRIFQVARNICSLRYNNCFSLSTEAAVHSPKIIEVEAQKSRFPEKITTYWTERDFLGADVFQDLSHSEVWNL